MIKKIVLQVLAVLTVIASYESGGAIEKHWHKKAATKTTTACGDLSAYTKKWQRLLALQDWDIKVSCAEIPDHEEAEAMSYPDPWRKEDEIIIDPRSHNSEPLVAHELVHAVLSQVLESKSEVVEEQVVVNLSELLTRLEGSQK